MKALRKIIVLLLIASLAFAIGCTKTGDEKITFGEVKDNTYTNKFFGVEFKINEGWTLATQEELNEFTKSSNQITTDEELKPEELRVLGLVMAAKYPMTYADGLNPNINLLSENLKMVEDVKIESAQAYLEATKTTMEQAGLPYTFSDITSETLGGKEFKAFNLSMDLDGISLNQRQYVALVKDYALIFTLTYSNDEELAELQNILNTIKFN